jgi:hypothetical protein
MPKTKHTATFNGQTFTRTSATRVYTHMVVARSSYRYALEKAQVVPCAESNFNFYRRALDGSQPHTRPEYAAERLMGAETVEQFIELHRAAQVAKVEQQKAEGAFDRFGDCGWCGRLDLAQKLAASKRAWPGYDEVHIVEAVTGT